VTLERRLVVLAGAAVAIAVAVASSGVYVGVRGALRDGVDRSLENRLEALAVDEISPQPSDARPETGLSAIDDPLAAEQRFGGTEVYAQVIASGAPEALRGSGGVALPVGGRDRAVAAGQEPAFFRDARVGGQHLRVLTGPIRPGLAVQLARPLTEVDDTLNRVLILLAAVTGAGLLLGAVFGKLVARGAVTPIRRLGLATRRVRSTRDLTARVEVTGRDEVAALAADFNGMLEALDASNRSQRQLVADASHELRTPVTSLRTYLEFALREDDLSPEEREQVLRQSLGQVEELSGLIHDLVELARGEEQEVTREPIRLDLLVRETVERASRRAPSAQLVTSLEPTAIVGAPDLLSRAVGNLLDNAIKWSPPEGVIDVTVERGVVTVRDHGPGIAPRDLPHVFDRFYRSQEARALPGSGLGLAIVRHVAELHGGTVSAGNAEGGGACLTLDLTVAVTTDAPELFDEPVEELAPYDHVRV
jgi:two-component system sensor histidine kinase MprB